MSLERALIRFPTPEGRRWLAFDNPIATWETGDIGEVGNVLRSAEAASRAGHWVVGMVSYDAAPAFDAALVALRDSSVPLVSFASFSEAKPSRGPAGRDFLVGQWKASRQRNDYESDIRRIKDLIAAGETYQVNYTMRLEASFQGDPLAFFANLSRAQRADHLAFLDLGRYAVCSASPELFLRREGDVLESRPMKGTRPRHPDPLIDRQLADELVASEKDRAENTMIVDMVRNDLGRIGSVGSLRTAALHTVESYPTVHQLTSTVTTRTSAALEEVFAATFPGASITGAPKVATSRFIADLERTPRGMYTGAIGALAPDGDFEFNIAIRTAWIDRVEGKASYGVGGGIVWDSDPASEWSEAHDKARVLYRADRPFRLLETIAWNPTTGAVLLDRHLERLAVTATHFGFDLDVDEVRRSVDSFQSDHAKVIRVLVSLDGAIELESRAMPPTDVRPRVVFDHQPIDPDDEFLRHKTTRRTRYEQARAQAGGADDVLLWNPDGFVTESTIANLVIELDGERFTPAESAGLLPGTFRAELLDTGRIKELDIGMDELRRATRCWLVNSVRGWVEIDLDLSDVPAELRSATSSQV